jgi:hypothetical protein
MKLPEAEKAEVDLVKITDYCLCPDHPEGKHKARVFASVLGLTKLDAIELRRTILAAALAEEAVLGQADGYGQRYVLDFTLTTPKGTGVVRTGWIILMGESHPRLVTCFVR